MSSTSLLTAFAVLALSPLAAAQPFLVQDINSRATSSPNSGVPGGPFGAATASIGDRFFFTAYDPAHGNELWVTDGTEAGTHIVKDIRPGTSGATSNTDTILAVGDALYFAADDGVHGTELWTSDGAEQGTRMVVDLVPGYASSMPSQPLAARGFVYFTAQTPTVGREMFLTDGTPEGTTLVRDVLPGSQGGMNTYPPPVAAGDKVFFIGYRQDTGSELWVADGAPDGAHLVRDLEPGQGDPGIRDLVALNGRVYFSAYTGSQGLQLWTSDATPAGTVMLPIPGGGNTPRDLVAGATRLYFSAYDSNNSGQICRTDGTPAGTVRMRSIEVCTAYGNETPATWGDLLFFPGDTQEFNGAGCEPWISDGTAIGTRLIRDIAPGLVSSGPNNFHAVPDLGLVFFIARNDSAGVEIWRTDGTVAGTFAITNFTTQNPAVYPALHHAGRTLYIRADDGVHGLELWASDGTPAGARLVRDIYPPTADGPSGPGGFVRVGASVYFQTFHPNYGVEPWITEARPGAAARLVGDINIVSSSSVAWSVPGQAAAFGSLLLFNATDGSGTPELWRTNGRTTGTLAVRPQTSVPRFQPAHITSLDNAAIFTAQPAYGTSREVWRTNATSAGTTRIREGCCFDQCRNSPPSAFARLGARVIFSACDLESGNELWATGGAADGSDTTRIADINPGSDSSDPGDPAITTDLAVFAATDATHGRELWATDGTPDGTRLIADLAKGIASSSPTSVTATPTRAFFFADDGVVGRELWITDGTSEGTHLVRDIVAGPGSPDVRAAVASGERFYFIADDHSGAGPEVWVSDGTPKGTHMIADLIPGNDAFDAPAPAMLTAAPDGRIAFTAPGDEAGRELWESDGTLEGTRRLTDINPGPGSSDPELGFLFGRTLLFSAFDPAHSSELWAYRFPGGPCPADWDLSGLIDSRDFFDYLTDFFNGAADVNADLTTDSADFFEFLTGFLGGC